MQTTRRGFVGTVALGAAAGALTGHVTVQQAGRRPDAGGREIRRL